MSDISISDMMRMQKALYEVNKDRWSPHEAKFGRDSILWMIDEIGEAIAIIKKQGDERIMNDPEVRAHFVEEMTDVMMYLHDALLCYNVSAQEFSDAYIQKHERNLTRWR